MSVILMTTPFYKASIQDHIMSLHQDLSLRRYLLWNQGQMDIFQ